MLKNKKLSYEARIEHCKLPIAAKLLQLMVDKKTNLALSADVTSAHELLFLAELLGPHICVLKTHIDIIDDFTPTLTASLRKLADHYEFMIFEDRKFADIGNTVKHQYANGIFKIVEWADIVNAHALPGPGIIKGLSAVGISKNRGLLLLAEMSSAGHLLDRAYQENTVALANEFPEFVMGFITQHALTTEPHWINMTPGIKLVDAGDQLDQRYVTPEQAIENGSDIIIVGRGILAADDPLIAAKMYREQGWNAYLAKMIA